jgi:acetyl-CoA carboxylase biotin carboxyl carrier protein
MMAARRSSAHARKGARKPRAGLSVPHAVEQIEKLIEVMIRSGAVEVEMQGEGQKLRVRLKEETSRGFPVAPDNPIQTASRAPAEAAAGIDLAEGQELFKSPMVGTFYRSPSPDAEPFIQAGDEVEPDTTLCIIEAMKVMNEIKAESRLQIIDVLAQNGEPVEFGQPLFLVSV